MRTFQQPILLGGFIPSEISQNWNLPQIWGEHKKYVKPPPSI